LALRRENFSDLAARVATGAAIAGVGLAAVWAGDWWFTALTAAIVGVLIWELARMVGADAAGGLALGGAAGLAILAAKLLPPGIGLALVLPAAALGARLLRRHRAIFAAMAGCVLVAGFGLILHRDTFGLTWMLWLALLVAATDVSGYFAGRALGGPKFWPRVSPSKTWAGTAAGWIAAAAVGGVFMAATGSGPGLIGISVALAMAGQMGDMAESALKRRMGVKDSSNLLPGHGGLFDRFDALLGAALVLLIIETVADFPPSPS